VQGEPVNDPSAPIHNTVPCGADWVPTSISDTVAVHVVGCPTFTMPGEQDTVVIVFRGTAAAAAGANDNPKSTSMSPATAIRRRADKTPRATMNARHSNRAKPTSSLRCATARPHAFSKVLIPGLGATRTEANQVG
jgi:hypothetical protein